MMRRTIKPKAFQSLAGYTEFIKSLSLSVIALTESKTKVDRNAYLNEENHAISIGWRGKPIAAAGPGYFDVLAELTVKVSKPKSQAHFFDLKAKYVLHIHCTKEFPKEFVARFCNVEVQLMIWPYFREFVTGMCGRMHIPPIFLPLATRTEPERKTKPGE